MKNTIKARIEQIIEVEEELHTTQVENIERAVKLIVNSLKSGGKVLVFGNGGSAADSQHIAAELVGRFKKERRAMAAIALTTNTSVLTALANDYGYDTVFARQVEALARDGDVAIGLSTSGNSKNVIEGLKKAKAIGAKTVGLAGAGGGAMKGVCDVLICANSKDTPRIQEAHILVAHIICELVESEIAK